MADTKEVDKAGGNKPLTADQELKVRELIGEGIASFRNWALGIGTVIAAVVGVFGIKTFADVKENARQGAISVAKAELDDYIRSRQQHLEDLFGQAKDAKNKVSELREEANRLLGRIDTQSDQADRQLKNADQLGKQSADKLTDAGSIADKTIKRASQLEEKLDAIEKTLNNKAAVEAVAKLLIGDEKFRSQTISVIEQNVRRDTRAEITEDGTGYLVLGETLICWGRRLLELPSDPNNRNSREFNGKFAKSFDGEPTVATSVLTAGSPNSFAVYRWKVRPDGFFGAVINHPVDARTDVEVTMEYIAIGRVKK